MRHVPYARAIRAHQRTITRLDYSSEPGQPSALLGMQQGRYYYLV